MNTEVYSNVADRQLDASIIEATSIDDTGRELSSSCPCTMQEIERHDEKKHRSTFFGDPNKQPLPGRGEEIGDNRIHDTACVKISISDIFALLQHPAGKRGSKEKERKKETMLLWIP